MWSFWILSRLHICGCPSSHESSEPKSMSPNQFVTQYGFIAVSHTVAQPAKDSNASIAPFPLCRAATVQSCTRTPFARKSVGPMVARRLGLDISSCDQLVNESKHLVVSFSGSILLKSCGTAQGRKHPVVNRRQLSVRQCSPRRTCIRYSIS